MRPLDPGELLATLRGWQDEMTEFLRELVLAESPTEDADAQDLVFAPLAAALEELGFVTRRLPGHRYGGQLYARPGERRKRQPGQLLIGHVDTVWPTGTIEEMPVEVREGKLFGPGSYDMKAGIVQMVFALRALHELGAAPDLAPLVFLNSDEEVGSPESRPRIARLARAAERAFVLEPSLGPGGSLKTTRKGGGRFTVSVVGRAAHAGLDPGGGASAIVELSHVIQALHALNDPERGVSVNVGTIQGGHRPNVVAAASRAVVDVRARTLEDARTVEAAIARLAPATPGVSLQIAGGIGRPPLEPTPRNRALWALAQDAAARLGIELEEDMAGGASDGNETSQFTATLDGLGAVGAGAHAAHEQVDLDRMPERAALLALLLQAPPLAPSDGAAVASRDAAGRAALS